MAKALALLSFLFPFFVVFSAAIAEPKDPPWVSVVFALLLDLVLGGPLAIATYLWSL